MTHRLRGVLCRDPRSSLGWLRMIGGKEIPNRVPDGAGGRLMAFPGRRFCAILPAWDPGTRRRGAERPNPTEPRSAISKVPSGDLIVLFVWGQGNVYFPAPLHLHASSGLMCGQRVGTYQSNPQPRRT